jgi:hypothetical protein
MSKNKPTHINLLDHWDEDEVLQRLVHANVSNLINRQFGLPRLPRFDDSPTTSDGSSATSAALSNSRWAGANTTKTKLPSKGSSRLLPNSHLPPLTKYHYGCIIDVLELNEWEDK